MLAAGLGFLYFGGEALVAGAVSIANRLRLPAFLIGLTVVGFGTSMPELVVSFDAAMIGAFEISLGNIIGSNTANILLILGLAAVISPISLAGERLFRDLAVMLAAALALAALAFAGEIGRWAGAGLLGMLLFYLVWVAVADRNRGAGDDEPRAIMPLWKEVGAIVVGLILLISGGDMLVSAATGIARNLGIPEAVIGLTIVAVGTSLPELATSVVAAIRKQSAIAVGNIVGSNIFNIAGILGVTAIFVPLPISAGFATLDIPVMIGVSAAMSVLVFLSKGISRLAGLFFLAAYAAYVSLMV
ncbi:MAG: calcium/sodium antiporter [Alphaproteobacteria bacterium]|nr:calcium/sodium antiporter [Alphaproteobacteria bacterium]